MFRKHHFFRMVMASHTGAMASTSRTALADAAVALVHQWLAQSSRRPQSASARRLARLVADPAGLAFTVTFVDATIRPRDRQVAARNLAALAAQPVPFLTPMLRIGLRIAGVAAPVAPWLVIPVARAVVRTLVSHLVLDARPRRLARGLARISRHGTAVNLNLLGEAVLGVDAARQRRDGIIALIRRPDVDYVSLKVSSVVAPHSPWGFDAAVSAISDELRPIYRAAAEHGTFVNLDMEEYRDLDLTIAVFTKVLDEPEFAHSDAGIVLQAYLPDALGAFQRLLTWASARVARGGSRIKVRIVKGANLSMEKVDAQWHGWPLATWNTKEETDAHYKRFLDAALTPRATAAMRIGLAGHNLFDIAFAQVLAGHRGVSDSLDVEMLLGMAEQVAPVLSRDVGPIRLYTPAVHPRHFDVAMAYLVRRLEEVANPQNFLSSASRFTRDPDALAREEERFRAAMDRMELDAAARHRGTPVERPAGFANQPDRDPATEPSRAWAADLARRIPASTLGRAAADAAWVSDVASARTVVERAVAAGMEWGSVSPHARAETLERAAARLESARTELVEVMASEAGKTIDQADPEVSEVVDFAAYYAARARDLDAVPGARPVPRTVTLVTPPWNFPIAIPGGSTLAALAAGSAVILKPAPAARRCAAVLAGLLWDSGVPHNVLQLVDCAEEPVGSALVGDPRVEQVILTGAYETAQAFMELRPGLRLVAETSGKNAIIVTPSADLDLAVRDVVQSAFGHAGQKCSAASLLILVGSVARSAGFLEQLRDAAASLRVGLPADLASQVGPLIAPPTGRLETGLTQLGAGESWLLEPRPLNPERTLWSPGIRTGVVRGSDAHLTEYFGPVLSVMDSPTLAHAIATANEVPYGLTAGLQSLDAAEISQWLRHVDAGNLYINRGITGAIVQRQPFGGWKRSAVGAGAKAGGPHYVERLTGWAPTQQQTDDWHGELRTALSHDFAPSDPSALTCERNVLRYVPARTELRVGAQAAPDAVVRAASAAAAAGGALVTFAAPPPAELEAHLTRLGLTWVVEDDDAWLGRILTLSEARVRAIGHIPPRARTAAVAIYDDPVTYSARLELFPFLREQSISMTAHRFGTPSDLAHTVDLTAARSAS